MAARPDVTLEVLASIKLGSDGIVNQKQFADQLRKQTAAMMKGVKIDSGVLTLDPKVEFSRSTFATLKKNLEQNIGALTAAAHQRSAGYKLDEENTILSSIYGSDKKARAATKRLNNLTDLQISQMKKVQTEALSFVNAREKLQKFDNQQLRTLTDPKLARQAPKVFNDARVASQHFLGSVKNLNKALGGESLEKVLFGTGADVTAGQLRGLQASSAELKNFERDLGKTLRIADQTYDKLYGIQSEQAKTAQRRRQDQKAQLALGRRLYAERGVGVSGTDIEPVLLARKIEKQALGKARSSVSPEQQSRFRESLVKVDSEIQTLTSRLREYRRSVDLTKISKDREDKALQKKLQLEKEQRKASRLQAAQAARKVDLSQVSDETRLKRLGEDVRAGRGVVSKKIDDLGSQKGRTQEQERLLGVYQRLRTELSKNAKAIDDRISAIRRERKASEKLAADLRKEADARRSAGRLARQALTAGTKDLGSNFDSKSAFVQRKKDLDGYVKRLDDAAKAERASLRPNERRLRAISQVRDRYVEASRTLDTYRANVNKATKANRESTSQGHQFTQGLQQQSKASANLRDRLGETGLLLRQFFRYALGYGALYKMVSAVTALAHSVVELDKELHSIQAIASATDEQMVSIGAAIKQVALETKFSTSEIAKSARVLAQAGVAPQEINNVLNSVAQFAAGTETAISTAADVVSTMRNVFKELDDVQIGDKLTKAINISKLTGEDLRVILSISAQTSKSFELSGDQFLAAAATLRNAGLKASTVATGLRQGLREIFNPDTKSLKALSARYAQIGEALNKNDIIARFQSFRQQANPLIAALRELDRLGFTGEGKRTFARSLDIRAENAITALINNLDKLEEAESRISLGGAAAEASAKQLESLSNSVAVLSDAMSVLAADILEGPVGSLQQMVETATEGVQALDELDLKLKSLGGEGVGVAGGAALVGGVAGAVLTRGKALSKVGGAILGASVGGSSAVGQFSQAENKSEVKSVESGISLIENVLLTLSAISLLRGKFPMVGGRWSLYAGALAGSLTTFSSFMSTVAEISGALWIAVKAGARLLGPVGWIATIAGTLYTVYDFFSSASDSSEDLARATKAAKERSIRAKQRLDQSIKELQDFQLTDKAAGIESAKGTSAAALEKATATLASSRQALSSQFLGDIKNVEKYASILEQMGKGKGSQEGTEERKLLLAELQNAVNADLAKANKGVSIDLLNLDGSRRRFLAELTNTYTGGIRSLATLADGLFKRYNRLATKSDKSELEQAFVTQMDQALQSNPILYRIFNGDKEAILELGGTKQVAEAIRNVYEAVAGTAGSIRKQVEEELALYGNRMATLFAEVSDKLASGEITQTQAFNMLGSEIDTLSVSSTSAADALRQAIQSMTEKLDDAKAEIERRNAEVARVDEAYGADTGVLSKLHRNRARVISEQGREEIENEAALLTEGINRAKAKLAGLNDVAAKINEETDVDAKALYRDIQENKAALSSDEAFKTALATKGAGFKALYTAARDGMEETFNDLYKAQNARESVRLGTAVSQPTRSAVQLQASVTNLKSRQAVAASKDLARVEQTKYAADPYTAVRVAELDAEIKSLKRRKSPQLFAENGPIKKKFALLIGEAQRELAHVNENIAKAASSTGEQNDFDKLQALRKKQAALMIKQSTLTSQETEQIQKAKDDYSKQLIETKKRRTASEAGQIGAEINDAKINGTMEELAKLQERRLSNAMGLLDLEKQGMLLQGKDATLVNEIISNRQEQLKASEEAKRTSENITRLEQGLYNVSTAPTTGDPALDKLREASGLGFTNKEKVNSLQGSLGKYTETLKELYRLQEQSKGNASDFERYQKEIDKTRESVSELVGQLDYLQTDAGEQLRRAFDPDRLLLDFQALDSAIQNFGDNVRSTMVAAFDQVGSSIVDAVVKGESAVEALNSLFYNMFLNIAEQAADTLMNQLYQGVLSGMGGENSIFGGLLGGGTEGASPEVVATNANVTATQANTLALQANTQACSLGGGAAASAEGGIGGLGGLIFGGGKAGAKTDSTKSVDAGFAGVTEAVNKVAANQGEAVVAEEGWFSQLGTVFSTGLSSLGGMLNSVFSSVLGGAGGGGGSWLSSLITSFITPAKNGIANLRFSEGGAGVGQGQGSVSASGIISGPGTSVSDSVAAALFGAHGVRPIAVATGESILNGGATKMLGENLINSLNRRGRIRGFAGGGVLRDKVKAAASNSTATAPAPNVNVKDSIKVVNVLDKSVMHDYATSSENERVILNVIQRNPRAIRSHLGG